MQLSANETPKNHRPAFSWDWWAAALLLAAVLFASSRLVASRSTEHLILISFLAMLACITGLALGRSRFSAWLSSIFGVLYGLFFIPWQFGLAFFPEQEWPERLLALLARIEFALHQFFIGENVQDPLLFLTAMAILFWLFGLNAGYRLARHSDPWSAAVPFGLAALIAQTYDSREPWKAWLIALFLLCLLLLLSRLQYLKQNNRWENQRVYVPFELGGKLTTLAFASAALLVLFAWATPALASSLDSAESFWSTVTSPWRAIRDELGRAVFSLRGQSFRAVNPFGELYPLGRGIPQSPTVVFTVQILQQNQVPLRYYWRNRVYDHYEDGRWTGNYEGLEVWDDSKADPLTELQGRTNTKFLFTSQSDFLLLPAAAQPVALERPAKYSYAANGDGSIDIGALFPNSTILPGESYASTSSLAVPTANQLQSAGSEYPEWITSRYLQLPPNFSPHIQELAKTLTANLETPYDKTVAITNYLRGALEYVEQMPKAPNDVDPIEWAVFEQKQGFCNYNASAEVLMLRSLGIPARLAVGYAQGEREVISGTVSYIVRQRDAHAWPEVYFPGIGWVEFEPTANQNPLIRPVETPEGSISLAEELRLLRLGGQSEDLQPEVQSPEVLSSDQYLAQVEASYFLPSMLLITGLLALAFALLWRRYRRQGGLPLAALTERGLTRLDIRPPKTLEHMALLSQLPPPIRAYMQINQSLEWLKQRPKPGDSPEERSSALAKRLPMLREQIQTLSRDYQISLYSRARVRREERAIETMKRIWWASRREQLYGWIRSLAKHRGK